MRPERRWVLIFAALALLAASLPYLIGYATQGEGWVFTGFVFGVEDGNSYIAKMLSGASGAWLFRTPYTAEAQAGVAAFLPYLLLGKLAAPPGMHLQLTVLFHLFRIGAGLLAILATYDFLAFFLRAEYERRSALALAVVGGGLGWLLLLAGQSGWLGSLPLEFYSPETFGFLGLYGVPHLALARAMLLWASLLFLRHTFQPRRPEQSHGILPGEGLRAELKTGLKIGSLWLILALAQPVTAVILGGLLGLYLLGTGIRLWIETRQGRSNRRGDWLRALRLAFLSGLLPAPYLLYTALAFRGDPFLQAWTAQNKIFSPHPLHYLLAYGLLLPFALPGARRLLSEFPWQGIFPVAWLLALPFLAYAPFNLQRRLPEGIWVALCLLAVKGAAGWRQQGLQQKKGWRRKFDPAYILLLAFPSTLVLLVGGALAASRPAQPLFRPAGEVRAFEYLAETALPGEIVLSAFETGNSLPAWAPVRVVIGHGPESAGLEALKPQVAAFYSSQAPGRTDLLKRFHARYVFFGPAERLLAENALPESAFSGLPVQMAGYLQELYSLREAYREGEYAIYRVTP